MNNDNDENNSKMINDIIIVGGGLSGLVLASKLNETTNKEKMRLQLKWKLLEATDRLGGRIYQTQNSNKDDQIDLGGAWIWPPYQPLMSDLIQNLGIDTFPQPDVDVRGNGGDTSTRIVGGAYRIVQRLVDRIRSSNGSDVDCRRKDDDDWLQTRCEIIDCQLIRNDNDDTNDETNSWIIRLTSQSGEIFTAKRVVFTGPPRILRTKVRFDPPLEPSKFRAMGRCRTWMAGVTKVALIYSEKFWTDDSGVTNVSFGRNDDDDDTGPAFQMYDGSSFDGSQCALTFFTLLGGSGSGGSGGGSGSEEEDARLAALCANQLKKYWTTTTTATTTMLNRNTIDTNQTMELAEKVTSYTSYRIKRWPFEPYISDERNPTEIHAHPTPVPVLSSTEWGSRLLFAGTETDGRSPGFMEGAVGSAIRVAQQLGLKSGGG